MTFFLKGKWYNKYALTKERKIFMTVYIDILFFVNFFMNYLIISVSETIAAKNVKRGRKLFASFLGGIYGVFSFMPDLNFIYSSLAVFFFSAVLVMVVFYPVGIREFLKYILCFYISSFLFSGGIYMVLPYIGGGIIRNNVVYYDVLQIIIPAIAIFFVARRTIRYIKNNRSKNGYRVAIKYGEKEAFFKAFLDTGNMLYEPFSGNAVVVADEMVLKKLFSPDCNLINITEWIESTDIRIIPYKTLDNEGVMLGFIPKEISVDGRALKDVIVAISPKVIEEGILINDGVF